jgi:hypothetical protein
VIFRNRQHQRKSLRRSVVHRQPVG